MSSQQQQRLLIRRQVLRQMSGGLVVLTVPVVGWWLWARHERHQQLEQVRTAISLPNDDYLITEKCQPGDVLVFDRRVERCAAGPWAALSCWMSRFFLTTQNNTIEGRFDHAGLIVPGYIRSKSDLYDPTNLLLLEATPSGIVARNLKERVDASASRSIVLLPLHCPGEKREQDTQTPSVQRTRAYVEKNLRQFRDRWTELGEEKGYKWIHSTVGLGGALAYGMGMQDYIGGPVSPSAYLVLMGLHQAAAAQSISERENLQVKVEDFLREHRFEEKNSVRLRPGWRFLSPVPVKEV